MSSIESLTKQTRLLQSILDNMGEGVIVADAEGKIIMFNPTAERIFGPGLVQRDFTLFADEQATEPCPLPLERCLHGDAFDELELLVRHAGAPDGTWVRFNGRPLRDATGRRRRGAGVPGHLRAQEGPARACPRRAGPARFRGPLRFAGRIPAAEHLSQGPQRPGHLRQPALLPARSKMPLDQLLGKTDFDLFPARAGRKYVDDDQRVLRDRARRSRRSRAPVCPTAASIFVQVVKTPVYDADGDDHRRAGHLLGRHRAKARRGGARRVRAPLPPAHRGHARRHRPGRSDRQHRPVQPRRRAHVRLQRRGGRRPSRSPC